MWDQGHQSACRGFLCMPGILLNNVRFQIKQEACTLLSHSPGLPMLMLPCVQPDAAAEVYPDLVQAQQNDWKPPSTWHLPLQLVQLAHSSSQQSVLQDLAPLLQYLFRAVNLLSDSSSPLNTASSRHLPQPGSKQHAVRVLRAASLRARDALFSPFGSLPGDWVQALMQLDINRQEDDMCLPQQLHRQLQRAWAALGNICERLTPELRPTLEPYLATLAAQCKVGHTTML